MRSIAQLTALIFCVLATPALAQHGNHRGTGPNGGRLEEAGPWHAELVTKGDAVSVYLSDEAGKPIPLAGFKGTAILVSQGKSTRIPLEPESDRLAGKAPAALGERPKGAVRVVAPDGVSTSVRFE